LAAPAPHTSPADPATANRLVARRLRIGFWLGLVPLAVYAITDLGWYLEHAHVLLPIKLAVVAATFGCMWLLRTPWGRRHPASVGLLGFAPMCLASALSGAVTGEAIPSAILIASLCLGTGALLPWGLLHQLALVVFGGACLVLNTFLVRSALLPEAGAAIAFAFGLGASLLTARETGRYRRERISVEDALLTKSAELRAINQAMTRFLEQGELGDASDILLRAALAQTESECGVAALVIEGPGLGVVAIAGIDLGDRESRDLLARTAEGRRAGALLEIAGLDHLVGQSVATGREVLTNTPPSELGAAGLPGVRPALKALLSVPVRRGREVVGVIALANRPGGYSLAEAKQLQALCQTASVIYDSFRNQEARRTDREVSAALARVGRELLSSVDAPALLERLCQVTTQVLGCESSHTLLYRSEERVFTAVAGHGDSPEDWESIKLLRLPAEVFGPLVARFDHVEVQEIDPRPGATSELSAGGLAPIPVGGRLETSRSLWVALRRGGEIIGLHTAGFRHDSVAFGQREERIFEGIGRLASLALRNALLVEELEGANRVRSEFVATMSHELRTPLNVVIGYCDMLREGALGELAAEQQRVVGRIQRNVGELRELVESTLDLSRLDAGRVDVDTSEVVLDDLFEELRADVEGLAQPGVQLEWRATPSLRISTDRMKVKILVKNLVRNALKFTHDGRVEVIADHTVSGGIVLKVRDTGIGIDVDSRDLIFEPFRRAVDEDAYGGVGLGLHIVRRLVETLGGALELESELGRGSTFTVRLPPVPNR
jgi:signal transduction histidine kinase